MMIKSSSSSGKALRHTCTSLASRHYDLKPRAYPLCYMHEYADLCSMFLLGVLFIQVSTYIHIGVSTTNSMYISKCVVRSVSHIKISKSGDDRSDDLNKFHHISSYKCHYYSKQYTDTDSQKRTKVFHTSVTKRLANKHLITGLEYSAGHETFLFI